MNLFDCRVEDVGLRRHSAALESLSTLVWLIEIVEQFQGRGIREVVPFRGSRI